MNAQLTVLLADIQRKIVKHYPSFRSVSLIASTANPRNRALGMCTIKPNNTYEIAIRARLDEVDHAEYMDTVWHEVIHALDHHLFGNFNHGHTWKRLMKAFGAKPQAKASVSDAVLALTPPKRQTYVWRLECVLCDKHYRLRGSSRYQKEENLIFQHATCACGNKLLKWVKLKA